MRSAACGTHARKETHKHTAHYTWVYRNKHRGRSIDRETSLRLPVYAFCFFPDVHQSFFLLDRTLNCSVCFRCRCLPILLLIVLNCFLASVFAAGGTSHTHTASLVCCGRSIDRSRFGVVMAAASAGGSALPPWILMHGIHDLGVAHFAHLTVRNSGKQNNMSIYSSVLPTTLGLADG